MDSSMGKFNVEPCKFERGRMKELEAYKDIRHLYGVPTRCPCGGRIVHDVCDKPKYPDDFDTLPGTRYFSCKNYKSDGLHFRQPWIFGVTQEIEILQAKVEEQKKTIVDLQNEVTKLKQLVCRVRDVLGV